jgi:DNA (cytosine-5)-methyltransferase 1
MAVAQPIAPTLTATNDPSRSPQSTEVTNQVAAVHAASMAVRRLTPIECERLQGFPDNYTNIPWRKAIDSPDGPRYKALGNSMAVPVMKWIGERLELQMPKPAG